MLQIAMMACLVNIRSPLSAWSGPRAKQLTGQMGGGATATAERCARPLRSSWVANSYGASTTCRSSRSEPVCAAAGNLRRLERFTVLDPARWLGPHLAASAGCDVSRCDQARNTRGDEQV